ncbi:MAG: hypothetical protein ABI867_11015 [Kofleriaceae bacterium]
MRCVAVVVVLGACSTPAAPITGRAAGHSARELAGYPSVVEPAGAACTLRGAWEYDQPDALRFRDGGPVYATVHDPKTVQLELAGTTAFVDIEAGSVRLWGYVDRAAVRLHAARAFVFADYLIPGHEAVLRVIDAKASGLTVELAPPAYVKGPGRGVRSCGDLALVPGDFDPRALIREAGSGATLAAGAIPLAIRPTASPIAELQLTEETPVEVLAREAGFSRVLIDPYADPAADLYVVGWVPDASVTAGASGHGISDARGGGRGGRRGRPRGIRHVRCSHQVPLVVDLAGERHLVGAIKPGSVISVLDDRGAVALDRIGIELADAARAFANRDALQGCPTAEP